MLLKCKDVAHLASDYLDKNLSSSISLRLRWHLMLCANCRRFVKHLETTKVVAARLANPANTTDAEAVWAKLKMQMQEKK
jgi:hypothetical protein